ncbi:MAG: hypothetical protein LBH19_15485 [Dysgonamonadaceae bacterium]|jgi:phosphate uptake regulator|nr:hypothetical protein [Dysgonamonadaceae bacterium]
MVQDTIALQENLNKELEAVSIILINQFGSIEALIADGWQDAVYSQLTENEKMIDEQENLFIKNASIKLAVMANKAKLLRKIASTHQAILFMEIISELTIDFADNLKKIDLNKPECAEFKGDLQESFGVLKNIVHTVVFGLLKEDIALTYPIAEKSEEIDKLLCQTMENLLDFYREIPLDNEELQCLLCQSHIICLMEKIQKFTINIAKLIIFVSEGPDIRRQ